MKFFSVTIIFIIINSVLKFFLVEVIDDSLYAYYQSVLGVAGFAAFKGPGAFVRNVPNLIRNKKLAFYYNKITIFIPLLVVFLVYLYIQPNFRETILLLTACTYYLIYDYLNQLFLLKNRLFKYVVIEFTVIFSLIIVYTSVFFELYDLIYYSLIPSILFIFFTHFNFQLIKIKSLNKDFIDKYKGNLFGSSLVFFFPLIIYQFSSESSQIGLQIAEFYLFNLMATFNIIFVNKTLYNSFDFYKNKIVGILVIVFTLQVTFLLLLRYVDIDLRIFQYVKTSNLMLLGIFYVVARTIYSTVFAFSRFLDNSINFSYSEFFRLIITLTVFLIIYFLDFTLLESMYLSIGLSMLVVSFYYMFKLYDDKKIK